MAKRKVNRAGTYWECSMVKSSWEEELWLKSITGSFHALLQFIVQQELI